MVLRQLEYLVALAREKHFGRAAEACHVTQPTLSAAIRQLEEDLVAPIIERGHRFIGLTAQGRLTLEHAHRILAEAQDLRREIEELDKGLGERLRLGVIPTALPIVSHLMTPFYQRFPNVAVTVPSRNSPDIHRGIKDFELDAGITYLGNEPLDHVRVKPIYEKEFVFLTLADGPVCRSGDDFLGDRRNRAALPAHARHAESTDRRRRFPVRRGNTQILHRNTRAIDLIEPTARRSVGYIVANRDPVSPLARNLLAMPLPPDILAAITPRLGIGAGQ
jgi:DNA-binding transcriptional LysR family regulator